MPPASPSSLRGDGGGGGGDGDRETEEAVVAVAVATRVSSPAGPLSAWGRRGRWPGPGCLGAPSAAASAPA